jgi:energy-coupling factor transport system ATP-binding protein
LRLKGEIILAILKTEELTYVYSEGTPFQKTAIDHVNLEIDEGEIVGVMGHTGSGKSTLIQHFNGLLRPSYGKVLLDGKDIWADKDKIRDVRFKVGLVFQYPEYQLFEETVFKDIAFGPKNMGLDDTEIKRRVYESAEDMGITEEMLERSPFELSGGQKRRVAIAGIMAMQPRVLILDEPTAGLDPAGRDRIFDIIKKYHRRTGNTILIVSHSMEDIARFSDKILVMNNSRLFCYDDTEKVFGRAEEIEKIGLDVPQITKVFRNLRNSGLDFGNVYTVEYAKKVLLKKLEERRCVD